MSCFSMMVHQGIPAYQQNNGLKTTIFQCFYTHPSSLDVNPMELVWHKLKNMIQALPYPPTTFPKLIKAVHEAWDALEIPNINKYIDTMSNRVQAVLEANGGHTRF